MRTFKTIEVPAKPATTRSHRDKILCAFCKKEAYWELECHTQSANWNTNGSSYEFETITIMWTKGSRYPEGGGRDRIEWDVCPDCFDKIIRPHLPEKPCVVEHDEW